ncbi:MULTISPECIES: DUF2171 domain-containing protein [Sphingobium]|uniref:DUF2171 domain-containing protein n=1 Tax=Sphingobium TaxID=165695 RepID=UPI00184A5B36|nr:MULTISPECIES: DUF2171 domain-containing protein [Sphingobium]MCW2362670.1 hypothetical protein [Sphingobium sp. B10D3B]MCW2400650.1 hypothetical protein [Sphingobium sp. B10D7B]MCW2407629.1 hypothetical protein [Sphingobium xanthum]
MFEKWRIKEHMEVADASGRHVGTVDKVDGDLLVLTRTDSADSRHHQINLDYVDSIHDDRVTLKHDTPMPEGLTIGGGYADGTRPGVQSGGVKTDSYAGSAATTSTTGTNENSQIFGTSGLGTGMGGSGTPST